ncbi:hypothetical protein R3W88_012107 [Solanum pinnatisectum]|uniref:Uncharacterized protein n=1 Tax=Solanum pinnatisectum TaxID=50273 RepID=A0AAV9L929_9SOLN|nr:hypothetical protein R3W88_012107 [Solanum pinnatisectum]
MLHEQEVTQLEKFHLPLCDQMLLLEGANTTTNTIIDVWETVAATREVTLKAPIIEDIDKTIVVVSEQMEIIKMLQEEIFSHICAAVDFVESELQATNNKKEGTNNVLEIMLAGYCPKIAPNVFNELKMWSCSQHTIKCLLDASEIGARYIVLVTIFFKLVEKVVVPWSACLTIETLQLPMPSIHNVLEELNPTIFNALRSKLHKVFNVGTLVPPSSSLKKLFDVNLVRHGYILWFKK